MGFFFYRISVNSCALENQKNVTPHGQLIYETKWRLKQVIKLYRRG